MSAKRIGGDDLGASPQVIGMDLAQDLRRREQRISAPQRQTDIHGAPGEFSASGAVQQDGARLSEAFRKVHESDQTIEEIIEQISRAGAKHLAQSGLGAKASPLPKRKRRLLRAPN
jgi:hypothetical protein